MTTAELLKELEKATKEAWRYASTKEGARLAKQFRRDLIKNIKSQKFPVGPPLNPKYLKRKKALRNQGISDKMLIATGDYIDNIVIYKVVGEKRMDTMLRRVEDPSGGSDSASSLPLGATAVAGEEASQIRYLVKPSVEKVKYLKAKKLRGKSNLTYEAIGKIHEMGCQSRNIPRRPHWGPTRQEFNSHAPEHAREIQRVFMERLKKSYERILSRA